MAAISLNSLPIRSSPDLTLLTAASAFNSLNQVSSPASPSSSVVSGKHSEFSKESYKTTVPICIMEQDIVSFLGDHECYNVPIVAHSRDYDFGACKHLKSTDNTASQKTVELREKENPLDTSLNDEFRKFGLTVRRRIRVFFALLLVVTICVLLGQCVCGQVFLKVGIERPLVLLVEFFDGNFTFKIERS